MTTYPHPLDDGCPPTWATEWGEDRHGVFVAFEVEGIAQRMRYIPPGPFMMGSPDDEPGRVAREGPRREVTIDEGFWLGDTPCTQALWTAIVEKNPSEFEAPDRPVESVSWDDCQSFLGRLNERLEGPPFRLPSEPEWEYACRAGTETAIWTGDLGTENDKRALAALDPIAWYRGNSERKTHAVAQKRPNPLGLFDILGNVYEWCDDLLEPYPGGQVDGWLKPYVGSARVFRGGSWSHSARLVRAAYRRAHHPGYRWLNLGFRLARAQE